MKIGYGIIVLCVTFALFVSQNITSTTITHAHLTDAWYPNDPKKLSRMLETMEKDAQKKYDDPYSKPSSVRAIIVPHAGVSYSGTVASAAYRKLDPLTKRIIILAPDHRGVVSTIAFPSTAAYAVPNGTLSIDTTVIKNLIQQKIGIYDDTVFNTEHACEIQLPFIAHYCPKASIIPLIVGNISCNQAHDIAGVLKQYIDKNTVVLVSSDFIHYGHGYTFTPFSDHQQLRTRHLHSQALRYIEHNQCNEFHDYLHKTGATICGASPLFILLNLLGIQACGSVEPRLVAYDTSSKSNTDDFVSYISMIFTTQKRSVLPFEALLTHQEKQGLITQAYDTLTHMFDKDFDETLYYPLISYGLISQNGAFTTLYGPQKILRGCIGRITTREPLYKTVATVTQDAAQSDNRFKQLTKEDSKTTTIHLSVVSKPEPIKNLKEIILGKDGVIFEYNNNSSLFLPEVATEQGWSKEELLTHLAEKAGLSADTWKNKKSQFKKFSTIMIS